MLNKKDVENIESILNSLKRSLGNEGSDETLLDIDEKAGTFIVSGGYRNSDFFESRPGEEDDDYPTFTGQKEVEERVKRALGNLADKVNIKVEDSEKSWFEVYISGELDIKASKKVKADASDIYFTIEELLNQFEADEITGDALYNALLNLKMNWTDILTALEKRTGIKAEGEEPKFAWGFYELEFLQKDMESMADSVAWHLMENDKEITPEVIQEMEFDIESEVKHRVSEWFEWYSFNEAEELAKALAVGAEKAIAKIKERKIERIYNELDGLPEDIYLNSSDIEDIIMELDEEKKEYTPFVMETAIRKKLQQKAERS